MKYVLLVIGESIIFSVIFFNIKSVDKIKTFSKKWWVIVILVNIGVKFIEYYGRMD